MMPSHVGEDCNPAGSRNIASLSVPFTEEERLRMLHGVRNALLLVLPFWLGPIYWITR